MDLSQRQSDILVAMPLNCSVTQKQIIPQVNVLIEARWNRQPVNERKGLCLARNLGPSLARLERLGMVRVYRCLQPHRYHRIQMSLEDLKCG